MIRQESGSVHFRRSVWCEWWCECHVQRDTRVNRMRTKSELLWNFLLLSSSVSFAIGYTCVFCVYFICTFYLLISYQKWDRTEIHEIQLISSISLSIVASQSHRSNCFRRGPKRKRSKQIKWIKLSLVNIFYEFGYNSNSHHVNHMANGTKKLWRFIEPKQCPIGRKKDERATKNKKQPCNALI